MAPVTTPVHGPTESLSHPAVHLVSSTPSLHQPSMQPYKSSGRPPESYTSCRYLSRIPDFSCQLTKRHTHGRVVRSQLTKRIRIDVSSDLNSPSAYAWMCCQLSTHQAAFSSFSSFSLGQGLDSSCPHHYACSLSYDRRHLPSRGCSVALSCRDLVVEWDGHALIHGNCFTRQMSHPQGGGAIFGG